MLSLPAYRIPDLSIGRHCVQGGPHSQRNSRVRLPGILFAQICPTKLLQYSEFARASSVQKFFYALHDENQKITYLTTLTQGPQFTAVIARSEEHTSELQSRENLVCRL